MISIDKQYNVIIVNHSMKRNANQIIGKEIEEGMNLVELLGDSIYLSTWTSVLETRQPAKQIFAITRIPYKVNCYPVLSTSGEVTGAYGIFKPSIKTPLELASMFQTLADRLPHLVWLTNPNGEPSYTNQKWREYTGLPLKECQQHSWIVIVHPDDVAQCMKKWFASMETGNNYEVRYRMKRSDGVYRWHIGRAEPIKDESGQILWWLGTCTDIEDDVQVQSQLSTATAQLSLLMSAAHFGVWSWDIITNDVHIDDNVMEMFNINPTTFKWTLKEIISQIHPEDSEKVAIELKRAVDELDVYDAEFRIKGTERILAGRGKLFDNGQGNPTRMIGINWDITPRKRLEQEKVKALQCAEEEARKRIQEAQEHHKRLEEFVDTICHEIRNPLNGITGIISLMRTSMESIQSEGCSQVILNSFKQITDCLGTLEQCAEQQQVIVDDVLDLSKVEKDMLELNPTVFNLKNLIETVQGIFNGAMKMKNLEFSVIYQVGAEGSYKADSHRLSQILMNLISNSIKFTEAGSITIDVSKDPLPDNKCQLRFEVSDTGIGMTSEELTKLFNKFSQANPLVASRFGGSGLGLIISKKLVERMGGRFEVESQKGVGTKFRFSILCEEVEEQHPASDLGPSEACFHLGGCQLTSKRVLIVEDNVINQKILMSYMQQKNCICQVANNGVEAVAMCEESKFDIIFMDLEMPIMGGLEATRKLREKSTLNQNTMIIGLSGNARKEHKEEAIRSGMNAYLTKPYHKTDIYKTVLLLCSSYSVCSLKRKRIQ